jgi:hypothetical protein
LRSTLTDWCRTLIAIISLTTLAIGVMSGTADAFTFYNYGHTLNGVSCTGKWCMAVGSSFIQGGSPIESSSPISEVLSGGSSSLVPVPNPDQRFPTGLSGVSCSSAVSCIGVGTDPFVPDLMSVESWNGASWSVLPNAPEALSVSCVPGPNVWCVTTDGFDQLSLWDGSVWSTMPGSVEPEVGINAVSCTSEQWCIAVGTSSSVPFIQSWDGATWSTMSQAFTSTGSLGAVSCSSPQWCVAIVSGHDVNPYPLRAEDWNGSMWSAMTLPNPSTASLTGVSCASQSWCVAVGPKGNGPDSWNGTSWSLTSSTSADLTSDSCTSPKFCVAVGSRKAGFTSEFHVARVADLWNGSTWSMASNS